MRTGWGLIAFVLAVASAQTPDPLNPAKLLLREGKTSEARAALDNVQTDDAETWYQRARSHLLDFYQNTDAAKRRNSLALAMEAMTTALARNANHIPTLRAKAVIHGLPPRGTSPANRSVPFSLSKEIRQALMMKLSLGFLPNSRMGLRGPIFQNHGA